MATVAPVVSDLVDFLNASPTAFHAVGTLHLLPFPFFSSRIDLS
jgi:hypothetical protein